MVSVAIIILLLVVVLILILVATIATIYGASKAGGSPNYNTTSRVRSAYSSLVAASVIGAIMFVVLLIMLLVFVVKNPFSTAEIGEKLIKAGVLMPDEVAFISSIRGKLI